MSKLRGAMIGVGFFAVNQLNAWHDIEDVEIVAICDRNPERLNKMGDRFAIAARYQDAAEMLAREQLDFVDIATTVSSHRTLVELAADHKMPVICQKPFATSLHDARAVVATCNAAGVPLMVHENFRWQTPILAVKNMLASDRIGRPFWARFSFRTGYDVYAGQPYLAEGDRFIIEDTGIHLLDVARFLLGEVTTIATSVQRINNTIRGEDVATMLMSHAAGATSVVDCSFASRPEFDRFPQTLMEIEGEKGSLRLDRDFSLTVVDSEGTSRADVSPFLLPWAERPWHNIQESVLNIQKHWVQCLRLGTAPATSGHDNLKTIALVEAAYEGAKSGTTVRPGL
ncbi:Gfo/Idh/MocA family oxidoreductase [Devosia algicola]|uniref:Gfo/Idh/MocA family oxidoreductase n=1 Tax=Devosia algicola TaxID=3026418 RepID=A0ABY7YJS9_9HYPH|nr:Gfo/Idh/MocA family oxidoreductase [Devosia algicola]WDR01321.1 Gfo/Idh/MocA family oxidoreductase [Devosia algicola]WDR01536.1 Gfo/Idh/MocA family oxidoreductase [Devosia algicola]